MTIYHESIHAYIAAINALDPNAFAACFTPDCELHDPVGAPPHRGRPGAKQMIEGFLPLLASIHLRPGRIFWNGRSAAFTWALEAKAKNGNAAAAEGIDVVEFDEAARITRTYGYWDPASLVAALGAASDET